MQKLIGRMEEIDVKLVEGVYREFNRKRSQKLFFKATGQVAAYKCICKGLDYEHVSDYLLIALAKMRIWETLTIITQ